MKIVFYNESLLSGGIEKCLEVLSERLTPEHEIEIVYVDDKKLDPNIVKILSKNAYVHKLSDDEIVTGDICIYCRIYLDSEYLTSHIKAKTNILWIHSKPRELPNCILDNSEFMNNIDKIICVSETVKKETGFPDKSIVIHNFMNENIHELAKEIDNPFSDIPESTIKFLIVSRLSFHKGFDRIEKLIEDLSKTDLNFVVKIIGKGRQAEPIVREALGKFEQVEFLGYKDNPYPYIKNADCILTFSDYETWGNVITEAKMLGTPCIVTNFSSAKEQIEDGVNGMIVPLTCDNYSIYFNDVKSKLEKYKHSLSSFKYINEIDEWKKVLSEYI